MCKPEVAAPSVPGSSGAERPALQGYGLPLGVRRRRRHQDVFQEKYEFLEGLLAGSDGIKHKR